MYPSKEQIELAFNIVMGCPPEGFETIDELTYQDANLVLRMALGATNQTQELRYPTPGKVYAEEKIS